MARMCTEGSVGRFFPVFSSLIRHKSSLFRKTWSSRFARREINKWELNKQPFNLTKRTFSLRVTCAGKQLCGERRQQKQLYALSIQPIGCKLFFYWFVCPAASFQNMGPVEVSAANNIRLCLLKHSHTPGLLAVPPGSHTPWGRAASMPGTRRGEVLFSDSKVKIQACTRTCTSAAQWESGRSEKQRVWGEQPFGYNTRIQSAKRETSCCSFIRSF